MKRESTCEKRDPASHWYAEPNGLKHTYSFRHHRLISRLRRRPSPSGERGATAVEYALMVGLVAVGIIVAVSSLRDKISATMKDTSAGFNMQLPASVVNGQTLEVDLTGIEEVWTYDYIGMWNSNPGTLATGYYAYRYIQNQVGPGGVEGFLPHKPAVSFTVSNTIGTQWVCLIRHKNQALGAPPIQEFCRKIKVT